MKVTLIANTGMHTLPKSAWDAGFSWPKGDVDSADFLAETAGRACYQAWGRKNPATATNEGYLANILAQGHESVLEHASATFYIEGVSRALTHELIRHRHLSYSELSQRYVSLDETDMVQPPAIVESNNGRDLYPFFESTERARDAYMDIVEYLQGKGYPRKQAREAARAVLPNATETKIVVTGNMRAWRDVLKKRWHVAADAEIRQLAGMLLTELREIAPNTFQDIPTEPYE